MSKYDYACACGAGIARSKLTGLWPQSCITCRLVRVEEDLTELRRAHGVPLVLMPAVLRSGEAPEVLTEAEQDAKSWIRIEAWYRETENPAALCVSFEGPFHGASRAEGFSHVEAGFYYCRLPGGGHSARGNTRADALAHAAQWCVDQMALRARTCSICNGRERDHAGEFHPFTLSV